MAKTSKPSNEKLAELFAELQRIEESRSLKAEKEIGKIYKTLLNDLQEFVGGEYAKYAEDDVLTYAMLQQKGQYARFLEEVRDKANGISPKIKKTITDTCENIYKLAFDGMTNAVKLSANDKELSKILSGLKLTQPQVIKAATTNPIAKLTLSKTLEKHRKEIIYSINKTVTNGIMNGDRLTTMANRIKNEVGINYRKAMLVARTETHRVRETGHNDSAMEISNALEEADSDYRMVKIWRSMHDSKVRHTKLANHRKANGQVVLEDEEFELENGVMAKCPGQSGTPYNDCNCRCYASHDLWSDDEFFQATGRHFPKKENVSKEQQIEDVVQKNAQIEMELEESETTAFVPAKTVGEAEEYAEKFGKNVSYKGATNVGNLNTLNKTLNDLTAKYPIDKLSDISTNARLTRAEARASFTTLEVNTKYINAVTESKWKQTIETLEKNIAKVESQLEQENLSEKHRKQIEKYLKESKETLKYKCWTITDRFSDKNEILKGTITHEYGHIIADQYIGQINGNRAVVNLSKKPINERMDLKAKIRGTYQKAKKNGDIYSISMYANTDEYEFFAETFCAMEMGVELPDYVTAMLKEVIAYGTV